MNEFVDHATTSGWRKLRDEFDEIKGTRAQPDDSECKAWKQSKGKNRYSNVKCLDATRVKLTLNVPPESDYINASHIQMKGCDRKFIATQCPLPGTAADFWRMIYQVGELQTPAILMLCQPKEERQNKSYQYWPTKEQPEKLFDGAEEGIISVTNKKSKKFGQFTVETLEILPVGYLNAVTAVLYTNFDWPDGYIARDAPAVLSLLEKIRENALITGPWVVHCSAGRGRTGTLIAIEVVIQQLINGRVPSVPEIVTKMRKMRSQVVTQPIQYIFIYVAVLYHCHGIPKMMQVADDMHRMTNYIMDLRNMTIGLTAMTAVGILLFLLLKYYQGKQALRRGRSRNHRTYHRHNTDSEQSSLSRPGNGDRSSRHSQKHLDWIRQGIDMEKLMEQSQQSSRQTPPHQKPYAVNNNGNSLGLASGMPDYQPSPLPASGMPDYQPSPYLPLMFTVHHLLVVVALYLCTSPMEGMSSKLVPLKLN